ncbi:MAG TPA: cytochrome ubiquinol oxidase subunit I, partial [Bacillota bacterium]|nr:cytochrome ubiquinol oxidase subunit I [Bacillota bacterium]
MNSSAAASASPLPQPLAARHANRVYDWVVTVDHKRIGILYLLAALVFFAIGGTEALIMRLQLAQPNSSLVSP